MSFRKPCHMPFRKLIPSFTFTAVEHAACFCKLIINRPGTQVSVLGVELNEITGNLKAYCFFPMTLYNTKKSAVKDVSQLRGDLRRKQNETGLEQLTVNCIVY